MNEKTKQLCISPNVSIMDAIKVLDETHERIVLVVEEDRLLGVVTDSDVRKCILKSQDMSASVTQIMIKKPICVTPGNQMEAVSIMEKHGVDAVPLIDSEGRLLDLLFRYEAVVRKVHPEILIDVPVVVMAGGKGTRLYPYTQILPKPLIPIGSKTIMERILESFTNVGCSRFYISVNYKKNLIKAFFQDMETEYTLDFVEEESFLGTAGSLYLVKDKIKEPFFVSNCDTLLDVDYSNVYRFHREKGNAVTMITSLKNYTIPYGIVNIGEDGQVDNLEEKPKMNFLVNTGVYLLNPEVLALVSKETFMHITDLIQKCMDQGMKVGVYPITEKAWEDMGELASMEEMLKARGLQE